MIQRSRMKLQQRIVEYKKQDEVRHLGHPLQLYPFSTILTSKQGDYTRETEIIVQG